MLIAIPAWIATDDPLLARLIMLAAATVFLITTSLLIFNDHTWFNPDEDGSSGVARDLPAAWRGRSPRCLSV